MSDMTEEQKLNGISYPLVGILRRKEPLPLEDRQAQLDEALEKFHLKTAFAKALNAVYDVSKDDRPPYTATAAAMDALDTVLADAKKKGCFKKIELAEHFGN